MFTEYIFHDKRIEVAVRDLKATLYDVFVSEEKKLESINNKISSETDDEKKERLQSIYSQESTCLKNMALLTEKLSESLKSLDSCAGELEKFNDEVMAELISGANKSSELEDNMDNDAKQEVVEDTKDDVSSDDMAATVDEASDNDLTATEDVSVEETSEDSLVETSEEPMVETSGVNSLIDPFIPDEPVEEATDVVSPIAVEEPVVEATDVVPPVIREEPVIMETTDVVPSVTIEEPVVRAESANSDRQTFTKLGNEESKAIIVTAEQGRKIRESLLVQEALFNAKMDNLSNNYSTESKYATEATDFSDDKVEPMLATDLKQKNSTTESIFEQMSKDAQTLYDDGKVEEAEQKLEELRALAKEANDNSQAVAAM